MVQASGRKSSRTSTGKLRDTHHPSGSSRPKTWTACLPANAGENLAAVKWASTAIPRRRSLGRLGCLRCESAWVESRCACPYPSADQRVQLRRSMQHAPRGARGSRATSRTGAGVEPLDAAARSVLRSTSLIRFARCPQGGALRPRRLHVTCPHPPCRFLELRKFSNQNQFR